MNVMAVNHEKQTLSPLPAEAKRLQHMNDDLICDMKACDVFQIDPTSENAPSASKSRESPNSLGTCEGSQSTRSEYNQENEYCASKTQSSSPPSPNPLDYSIGSKHRDSACGSQSHISPAVKSGSSCTSFIGSFSSSSSPSPPVAQTIIPGVKSQDGSRMKRSYKTSTSENQMLSNAPSGDPRVQSSTELLNAPDGSKRSKLETKDSVCVPVTTQAFGSTECHLNNSNEQSRPAAKRHAASNSTTSGGVRNSTSTAAYKYLTWREKDRRRRFREEWKHLWLVVPHGRYEVMCLVCHKVMTQRKLDTIKRHTVRRHVELLGMPETDRQNLFEQLLRQHTQLGSMETGNNAPLQTGRAGRKSIDAEKFPVSESCEDESKFRALSRLRGSSTACWLAKGTNLMKSHVEADMDTSTYQRDKNAKVYRERDSRMRKDSSSDYDKFEPTDPHLPFGLIERQKHIFSRSPTSIGKYRSDDLYRNLCNLPQSAVNKKVLNSCEAPSPMETQSPQYPTPFSKGHPSNSPFPFNPLFANSNWLTHKMDSIPHQDSFNNRCNSDISSSFTQILENLASPSSHLFGKNVESVKKNSLSTLTGCLNDPVKGPPSTSHTDDRNEYKGRREFSGAPRDLANINNLLPKQNQGPLTKFDTMDPLQYARNIYNFSHTAPDLLASPINNSNAGKIAAAAAAANSFFRLPPPPPNMLPTQNYLSMNPIINPTLMATWAAMMASAATCGTANFLHKPDPIPTKPFDPPFPNTLSRPPYTDNGLFRTRLNEIGPNRTVDEMGASKINRWMQGHDIYNNAIINADNLNTSTPGSFTLGKPEESHRGHPCPVDLWSRLKTPFPTEQYETSTPQKFIRTSELSHGNVRMKNYRKPMQTCHSPPCSEHDHDSLRHNQPYKNKKDPSPFVQSPTPISPMQTITNKPKPPTNISNPRVDPPRLTTNPSSVDKITVPSTSTNSFTLPTEAVVHGDDPTHPLYLEYYEKIMRQAMNHLKRPDVQTNQFELESSIERQTEISRCTQSMINVESQSLPSEYQSPVSQRKISHDSDKKSMNSGNKHESGDSSPVVTPPLPSPMPKATEKTIDSVTGEHRADDASKEIGRPENLRPVWSFILKSSDPQLVRTCQNRSSPETAAESQCTMENSGCWNGFDIQLLRLGPKQDLRACLSQLMENDNLAGAFILTCCGSLCDVRLRLANLEERTFHGPFEIVSLVGTLAHDGQPHLHISVADSNGKVIGGHLLGNAPVHTTAEIALGIIRSTELSHSQELSLESTEHDCPPKKRKHDENLVTQKALKSIRLVRKEDDATGFKELMFEELLYRKDQYGHVNELLK